MKRIEYLINAQTINGLLLRLIELRTKYRLGEAPVLDLITIYQYYLQTQKWPSTTMLVKIRYGSDSAYTLTRQRCRRLDEKGLIQRTSKGLVLTDLGLSEMRSLSSVTPAPLITVKTPRRKADKTKIKKVGRPAAL